MLWGPIGLVLATPMTACLVVLGRHLPELEFLRLLLGDEPALEPRVGYYQRLLANDQDEASDIIEAYATEHSLGAVYGDLLLPSLLHLQKDKERGDVTDAEEAAFLQSGEVLFDTVFPLQDAYWAERQDEAGAAPAAPRLLVYGLPAHCRDELVLEMFKEYVDPSRIQFRVLSTDLLLSDSLAQFRKESPAVVVLGNLPSSRAVHGRYLCKKIRQEFPDLKILVGLWGVQNLSDQAANRFQSSRGGPGRTTFKEMAHQLEIQHQIQANTAPPGAGRKDLLAEAAKGTGATGVKQLLSHEGE